ncbi:MAG: class I SAM-dependent methyltransferase [Rhodospirillaceae bacterium]|nr:class I SAM-dependent methyltransferase [Rhodospirillaceae bacterium]MCA8931621.1 class I SAM-dependent methyltransferase [Rhodospirillaceae bacterium]
MPVTQILPRKVQTLIKRIEVSGDKESLPEHAGLHYRKVLRALFETGRYGTYLEIGTSTGGTLVLATGRVIAVDPDFRLTRNVLPGMTELHAFQTTSDDFFATQDPIALMQGATMDLAFLDGMHLFEFLLRDFINTEKVSAPGTLILMHDCLPLNGVMAQRDLVDVDARTDRYFGWWAGDVWKMLPILAEHRPDLKLACINAPPTGLVAISGLDPQSTVLSDRYEEIVARYAEEELDTPGARSLHERFRPRPAAQALADLGHPISAG